MRLKKQKPFERGAGILLPVSSLMSPYGIGSLGREAWRFVEFLVKSGQRYWQVLPLGPTGYGDSPYQSFSAFAGNPYFIDLESMIDDGLLTLEEVEIPSWGEDPGRVDYVSIFKERYALLGLAFARSHHRKTDEYRQFLSDNAFWLEDYSLYMAIKSNLNWKSWEKWPEGLRLRDSKYLADACEDLAAEIDFWRFCQYKFFSQWNALKSYANELGVEIIGDIPIYMAYDSADVWANSSLFQLNANKRQTAVAGVPPDLFSSTGQRWGNPLYDWKYMEEDDFLWWRQRMRHIAQLYDTVRIDHFIGIVNYYSISVEQETAEGGKWENGPAERLISAIEESMEGGKIIAEDLGVVTENVTKLRERAGYPGMKLMKFAFEDGPGSDFLPCHFEKNTVAYAGTHDNETLVGYFSHQSRKTLRFARDYLGVKTNQEIPWAVMRAGYESSADTVIYQMQDLLGLGNEARTNLPSSMGGNWQWRLLPGQLTEELAERLMHFSNIYDRLPKKQDALKSIKHDSR